MNLLLNRRLSHRFRLSRALLGLRSPRLRLAALAALVLGAPAAAPEARAERVLAFDGATYVDTLEKYPLVDSASLSAWVAISNSITAVRNGAGIVGQGYWGGTTGLGMFVASGLTTPDTSDDSMNFQVRNGNTIAALNYVNPTLFTDEAWHHYLLVRDKPGAKVLLYVDGVLQGSADFASKWSIAPGKTFAFARNMTGVGGIFRGALADVALWDQALDAQDAALLQHHSPDRIGKAPYAYFPLDDGLDRITNKVGAASYAATAGTLRWVDDPVLRRNSYDPGHVAAEVLVNSSATGERLEPGAGFVPDLGALWASVTNGVATFSAPPAPVLFASFRRARVTGGTLYEVVNGAATAVATTSSATLSYAVGDTSIPFRMVWDVVYEDRPPLFVTPTGAGLKDGSSWANALAGWGAIAGALRPGDTVCLAVGDYAVTNELNLASFEAVHLRGGYAGTDDSAPYAKAASGETRLAVTPESYTRHLTATGIELSIEDIAFTDGKLYNFSAVGSSGTLRYKGQALYLANCRTTLANCAFSSNTLTNKSNERLSVWGYGGAVYAENGSLDVRSSRFADNTLYSWRDNCETFGGAIYALNASVTISDTDFERNCSSTAVWDSDGGALYLTGGNALVENCNFLTNSCVGNGHARQTLRGAAICAVSVARLDVRDSYFAGNWGYSQPRSGNLVYLSGSEATSTSRFERCVFTKNGVNAANNAHGGSIALNGGLLEMVNCLVAGTRPPNAKAHKRVIEVLDGRLEMDKCTVTDSNGVGVWRDSVYGTVHIRDSIVYGNDGGSLVYVDSATHSCVAGGFDGTGNFDADPLLSADGHYHPLSAGGRLADGFFAGSSWTADAETSPTLDAGDPAADWFDEPQPNNLRMNIGYDANTPAASKSATGAYVAFDSLAVVALPATNVTDSSAWARGIVGELGNGGDASVTLVGDVAARGTASASAWAHAVPLGAFAKWGHLAAQLTGLTGGTTYHYRFVASNASGTAWSDEVAFGIPVAPVLQAENASHLARLSAALCATFTSVGGADCARTFAYWPVEAPESVTTVEYEGDLAEGVVIRQPISGLTSGTAYGFRATAVNVAGSDTFAGSFTTVAADTPLVRYATPEGAGIRDGTSWENAYAGLLPPFAECLADGDVLYLGHGEYDQYDIGYADTHAKLVGAAGLSIYGGYEGVGAPGALSSEATVIRPNISAPNWRLIHAQNSVLRIENVTFRGSRYNFTNADLNGGTRGGAALWLENCHTVLTNCLFADNQAFPSGGAAEVHYGGAVRATSGSLSVLDCGFSDNLVRTSTGENGGGAVFGGAISAASCALEVRRTTFLRNTAYAPFAGCYGGAIYVEAAPAAIEHCAFYTNSVPGSYDHRSLGYGYGGAFSARNATRVEIADCHFEGNYGIGRWGKGQAGVAYFKDYDGYGVMTAVVTRCVFDWSGTNLETSVRNKAQLGSFHHDSGRLFMTNCLISRTGIGGGFTSEQSKAPRFNEPTGEIVREAELVNVTVADCAGTGVSQPEGGAATIRIRNGIVWGNTRGGVSNATEVAYTCSQEAQQGAGNFVSDPLFADAPHYHLISRAKYIADDWFGGAFVTPAKCASSPCLDAGDPAFDYSAEPKPHGRAINLGAYGGTPWASSTWFPPGTQVILR